VESRLLLFRRLWIGDVQWALFADVAYSDDAQPSWSGPGLGLLGAIEARRAGLGVGTGLRYVTPIGPFILDWAVDPFHFPANRVHLTFGYAF
jgi:outer membrane protein assembly factor BamA